MAKAYGLTESQAKRIGRVVLASERADPPRRDEATGSRFTTRSFWAEITGDDPAGGSPPNARHAWKLIAPDATGDFVDVLDSSSAAITGAGAFEANGGTASPGQRVELMFYGYDGTTGVPLYVFQVGGAALIKITNATRDGSNWRWTYTAATVRWDGGFTTATIKAGITAYNGVELGNGSSGTVSGINLADEVVGIEPIATGTIVVAVAQSKAGNTAYIFSLPNAPVIDCDAA